VGPVFPSFFTNYKFFLIDDSLLGHNDEGTLLVRTRGPNQLFLLFTRFPLLAHSTTGLAPSWYIGGGWLHKMILYYLLSDWFLIFFMHDTDWGVIKFIFDWWKPIIGCTISVGMLFSSARGTVPPWYILDIALLALYLVEGDITYIPLC